jgi:hypothetical protein
VPKFILPRRIEAEFQTSIHKLMAAITPRPVADLDAFVNDLAELSRRLDVLEIASKIAHRMATQVQIANSRSWREAAHRSGRGQMLYRALQQEMQGRTGVVFKQIIADNGRLISSVPAKVHFATSQLAQFDTAQGWLDVGFDNQSISSFWLPGRALPVCNVVIHRPRYRVRAADYASILFNRQTLQPSVDLLLCLLEIQYPDTVRILMVVSYAERFDAPLRFNAEVSRNPRSACGSFAVADRQPFGDRAPIWFGFHPESTARGT